MDRYFDLRPVDAFVKELGALWWYYLLFGLVLIAWGIAIIVWPQLLVALVAALFIVAGGTVLGLAWKVWRIQRRYQSFKREIVGP